MKPKLLILIFFIVQSISYSQTVHLVLLSDITDKNFGMISLQNEDYAAKICNTIANRLKYKLDTTYLNKDDFSSDAFKSKISQLKVSPDDIIFFLYSGKSSKRGNDQFPFLVLNDFKQKPINLLTINKILFEKKPFLLLTFADTRDTILEFPSIIIKELENPPVQNIVVKSDLRKMIMRQLFLSKKGFVIVSSSSKKEKSFVRHQLSIGDQTKTVYNDVSKSIFMSSLVNVFEDQLRTSIEGLNFLSLEKMIFDLKNEINFNVSESKVQGAVQTISTMFNLQPVARSEVMSIKSTAEIEFKFNSLLKTEDPILRSKTIQELDNAFEEAARITIKRVNVQGKPLIQEIIKTDIDKYLTDDLKNFNSKLQRIKVEKTFSFDTILGLPIQSADLIETWLEN